MTCREPVILIQFVAVFFFFKQLTGI